MAHPTWGIVATIKAPVREILTFVAHHLDLGADHLFIYLDNPNDAAQQALENHPNVTVTRTDHPYWKELGIKRPEKHQHRQTRNAKNAYASAGNLDWLTHIDVDEFLWPTTSVARHLADIPEDVFCARVRPAEVLSIDGQADLNKKLTYCKDWMPPKGNRLELSQDIYPTYGQYLRGGFLSHLAGKVFLRTGAENVDIRIHNIHRDGIENPDIVELRQMALVHFHATKLGKWLRTLPYRHESGSYRAEMRPAIPSDQGGLSLHEMFNMIRDHEGDNGLRAFFEEVCLATPRLRGKLSEHGLLKEYKLGLGRSLRKQFPEFSG